MKKTIVIIIILAVLIAAAVIILSVRSCSRSTDSPDVDSQAVSTSDQSVVPAEKQQDSGSAEAGESTAAETPEEEAAPEATPTSASDAPSSDEDESEEREVIGIVGGGDSASEPSTIIVSEETADNAWTEWDSFMAMSPAAQDEYMKSFESLDAFTAWMVAAQKEWAAAHPMEEIGPGSVIDFSN